MDIVVNVPTKVSLSREHQKEIVIDFLSQEYNLDRDMFIRDSTLFKTVKYTGSGTWYDDELIREATETDKFILGLIKELQLKD